MIIKSDYKQYLACPRQYALHQQGTQKAEEPYIVQRRYAQGEKVGAFALTWFNGVHKINPNQSLKNRILETQNALKNSRVIAEASFAFEDAFCAVDVLEKSATGWNLYEVKSKTNIETDMVEDATYQAYILKKSGISIDRVFLMYVNRSYVMEDAMEVQSFFKVEDITVKVTPRLKEVSNTLTRMKQQKVIPEFIPVRACNECPFKSHCFGNLPEDSMVNLYGYKKKTKKYIEGARTLEDMTVFEPKLNEIQRRQIAYYYDNQRTPYINQRALQGFVRQITYPIYYLDFETLDYVWPPFSHTAPNEKLPYQASLHIEPQEGDPLEHFEFLMEPPEDPRPSMIDFLINHIGSQGSIIVYHKPFEKGVLEVLAERFPEHADALHGMIDRLVDLKDPFVQGMIYTREMGGSFSIKKVYPAMVPEKKNAYKDLVNVQNGTDAMMGLETLPYLEQNEKRELRSQLLAYCKLDTLSMVEILDKIRIIL